MFTFSLAEAFVTIFIGMGPIKVLLIYIAKTQGEGTAQSDCRPAERATLHHCSNANTRRKSSLRETTVQLRSAATSSASSRRPMLDSRRARRQHLDRRTERPSRQTRTTGAPRLPCPCCRRYSAT